MEIFDLVLLSWAADLLISTTSQIDHPFVHIIFWRSMRVACLQFNPELGRVLENITRANTLLQAASPQNVDILVLPELAFTGIPLRSRLCLTLASQ